MARGSLWPAVGTFWRELGRLGRLAFVGVLVSGVVALSLGFLIPSAVRSHLIDARVDELQRSMAAVWEFAPESFDDPDGVEEFGEIARRRLLGGDTVRVKIWDASGRIVWSDEARLIGRSFGDQGDLGSAFAGSVTVEETDLTHLENEYERSFGRLIEFYLPLETGSGGVEVVFEVYQRLDPFERTLQVVRVSTWLRIGTGLGVLAVFMGALTLITLRGAERRREQSERLLHRSLDVREAERVRLANALHDDLGQPLYRLLYGLEALHEGQLPLDRTQAEAGRLAGLVRSVDRTLRNEMRRLQASPVESDGLIAALQDLASGNGEGPHIQVSVGIEDTDLDVPAQEALYRAAREAVANALRHSGAASVQVTLERTRRGVQLQVSDTGSWAGGDEGLGIATMRAMIEGCGGSLVIGPDSGGGTSVRALIPTGTSVR